MPRIPFAVMSVLCLPALAQAPGVFDQAAQLTDRYPAAAPTPAYTVPPITVDLRTSTPAKAGHNILPATEPRNSVTHWELFTEPGTGRLCAFWPGFKPDHVRSTIDVADDRWHAVAMTNDGASIALLVDGKEVAREKVEKVFRYPDVGPLYF